MRYGSSLLALSAVSLVVASCSSSSSSLSDGHGADGGRDGAATNASSVSRVVGASGGSVALSDESAAVDIPAGALPANTTITITATSTAPTPAHTTEVGDLFTFGPNGLTFMKPVTVTLAYDPSKLPSGLSPSSLVIYTAPDGSSTYSPLPSSVADGTHISATTTHFSTDGVFAPSGGGDDAASPVDATSGSDVDVGSDGGSAEDGGVPKDATTGKDSSSDATTPDGSSGDAAAIKDSAVDTGASCPLSCGADASIGSSVCTCDTACGGHSYQILCTMPGNACFCKKDGTQTMTFTGSSSSTEDLCGASYAECTFPGTLPTVGDSGSPHGDAGTTKDAGASCPLSCGEDAGSSSSACTCEATCGGHSYELLCTTPGNLCVCKEDGAQTMSFTGTTSSTETLCGANYMGCGYPGSM